MSSDDWQGWALMILVIWAFAFPPLGVPVLIIGACVMFPGILIPVAALGAFLAICGLFLFAFLIG